jgi:hypothetical protein
MDDGSEWSEVTSGPSPRADRPGPPTRGRADQDPRASGDQRAITTTVRSARSITSPNMVESSFVGFDRILGGHHAQEPDRS